MRMLNQASFATTRSPRFTKAKWGLKALLRMAIWLSIASLETKPWPEEDVRMWKNTCTWRYGAHACEKLYPHTIVQVLCDITEYNENISFSRR